MLGTNSKTAYYNVNTVMDLLTYFTKTTYFQLNIDVYEKKVGIAMGSSLSPVLSDMFTKETNTFSKEVTPLIW